LAGVFLVLPSFAVGILAPPPEPPAGADGDKLMAILSTYYSSAWPWLLGMAVCQVIGTLAMLALYTDRTRPTVAEALQLALRGALPVILAQILAGMAFAGVALALISLAAMTGSQAAATLMVTLSLIALIYVIVRISLVAPVVMVDGERNPIAALKRSWALTRGNAGRLLLFYALLLIGFGIVILLVGGLADLLLRLALGMELGTALGTLVSAALQAVMAIFFMAVYAATHRQLARPEAPTAVIPIE
ncbi:MAG TPA: hypothetical protein VFV30_05955, partial [Novosphingobium sp.]|nr:hypothetical protein [Novosphingobium sp.]